jgi:dimethylglycine dehydrogenase
MTEQSITKIDDDLFYLVGPILSEYRDEHWMKSNSVDFAVEIINKTESLSSILLTGPKSREILQKLTTEDLSNNAFPWLSCKKVQIDSAFIRIIRVSYAGELGYELHMPNYHLLSIYESLFRVGEEFGLKDFGGYALNSMRMEKMYRSWGSEFTEEISGVEAGMERFIDSKRDFIGAENIRNREKNGTEIKLAYLILDDDIPCECFGNEAVYHKGKLVGLITSGAFGHRVRKSLAFAYIKSSVYKQNAEFQILTSAGMRNSHIAFEPIYDPKNHILRS